jgi:hypothetical protein
MQHSRLFQRSRRSESIVNCFDSLLRPSNIIPGPLLVIVPRESRDMHLNVIIFGETGTGKSSIVNMFDGGKEANVDNGALGVTFEHEFYEKRINGSTFRVFDTVGLNEGTAGTVTAPKAIAGLYNLIAQLDDGVSLLVYVMRAPRIRATTQKNYDLFRMLCDGEVPIVMAVTGLEDMDNMDEWWGNNKEAFHRCNMLFQGVACITATRGKLRNGSYVYEAEFAGSKEKLEMLIGNNYSRTPWRMPRKPWFAAVAVDVHNKLAAMFRFKPMAPPKLCQALQEYGGLSEKEARIEACRAVQTGDKQLRFL